MQLLGLLLAVAGVVFGAPAPGDRLGEHTLLKGVFKEYLCIRLCSWRTVYEK